MAPLTMPLTITVPKEYGYVIAVTTSTFFLGFWHGMRIGAFRKASGMGYPKSMADSGDLSSASPEKKKAMYLFNCAQRAHGNYLENQPSVAIAMLVAGVRYPLAVAGLGLLWSVFRVVYAVGYTRADKDNGSGRLQGSAFWLAQLILYGMAGWTGISMVL